MSRINTLIALLFICVSTSTSFSQEQEEWFLEFDDTFRLEFFDGKNIDSVDFGPFREYRKLKVVSVDAQGKETTYPVIGGKVAIYGVAATNVIDSTGTIIGKYDPDRTLLWMCQGQQCMIMVKYENKDGQLMTNSVMVTGKYPE